MRLGRRWQAVATRSSRLTRQRDRESRSSGRRGRRTRSRSRCRRTCARVFSVHDERRRATRCGGAICRMPPSWTRYSAHDAGEVLDARHLDPRDVAGGGEAADPVAVGVAGEVAARSRVGGRRRSTSALGVVGVDAEVALGSLRATRGSSTWWWPNTRTGRSASAGRASSSHSSCSAVTWPCVVRRRSTCRCTASATPGSVDRERGVGGEGARRCSARGCRGRAWRRSPNASLVDGEERVVLLGSVPSRGEVALHHDDVGVDAAAISAMAPRFITSGYGSSPALDAEGRAEVDALDHPALDLAEVHVVDGGEGRPAARRGAGERAEREARRARASVSGSRSS